MCASNRHFIAAVALASLAWFDALGITEYEAGDIAQREITESAQLRGDDSWTNTTEVSTIRPLYLFGVDGVAYYECKAVTDGQDAGYVVVAAQEIDIPIVEAATDGQTLVEKYAQAIGNESFRLFRMDEFNSVALAATGSTVLASRRIHAYTNSYGIILHGEGPLAKSTASTGIDELVSRFSALANEASCHPRYSAEILDECYTVVDTNQEGLSKVGAYRWITAELDNYFPCTDLAGNQWHTPMWNQYNRSDNGEIVGCSPLAWSILYAYWHEFKGKEALFDFNTITNQCYEYNMSTAIKDVVESVAGYLGTEEGSTKTAGAKLEAGIKYAHEVGYGGTSDVDYGPEYNKFDNVKRNLDQDKPCLISIDSEGYDRVNHTVVIEAAAKSQSRYLWVWHDRNVKYLVNYGWGNGADDRKWIYVRDWGTNTHDVNMASRVTTANITGSVHRVSVAHGALGR